jgi:ABC-type polysaccharide/polyol phosphate transport system, ATPase component
MTDDDAVIVRNITKNFRVYSDKGWTLKERLVTAGRRKYQTRNILNGISFQVKKGEAVGLIGKNGCGKSTTLKMLAKIMCPDSGEVYVQGKVSSLLELGAGFHPDMSGRENIYLNASILGLTKKEIEKKIDNIIAFSELEEFIEDPVRTYSSGMYMRLAFSVAINVNADVLLIDEILGVGDVSFQKKCFERLQEIKTYGTTIIIVSHSLEQLEAICNRCIWICDGKIKEEGLPVIVNAHYYKEMEDQRLQKCKKNLIAETQCNISTDERENSNSQTIAIPDESAGSIEVYAEDTKPEFSQNKFDIEVPVLPPSINKSATRVGTYECEFTGLYMKNKNGNEDVIFSIGDCIEIIISFKGNKVIRGANISVSITRADGVYCYGTNTRFDKCKDIEITLEENEIKFYFDNIKLLSGTYFINLGLYDSLYKEYDVIWRAKKFYIKDTNLNGECGVFQMEHHWIY